MIKEVAWRGKGSGGGPRASVPGGVGGRGTGPRDGASVVFLSFLTRTKRRKMTFFEGCPEGWQPSPATKALGLPPRPPGQLRWVPPPPHVRVRNDKKPLPHTFPEPKPLDPPPEPLPRQANPSLTPKQHEANRDGYTSRGQPSNFRKITHLPFRNRRPWIPPHV